MSEKNKGGREARKPKAEKNIKKKGQTPPPAVPGIGARTSGQPKK